MGVTTMFKSIEVETECEITISVTVTGDLIPSMPGIREAGGGPLISPPDPTSIDGICVKFGEIELTNELDEELLSWLEDVLTVKDS
tara:strand:- start:92 stop:349 length:258 start_codon:yes stop_codon:yes gene_type:complete